jgi:sec-independent protein translocase protein TatA
VPSIGVPELIIILLIVLLLFGTTKLPALGRGMGEAIRNFKQGMREGDQPPSDSTPASGNTDKKA